MNFDPVDTLMKAGVGSGIFPGGVLLVFRKNQIEFFESYGFSDLFSNTVMTRKTIFDLASLTKPLATTLAMMELSRNVGLSMTRPICDLLPGFVSTTWRQVTCSQLLSHSAGFQAYHPYYLRLRDLPISDRRVVLRNCLLNEPIVYPSGQGCVYSDIGFMILEWIVEKFAGLRMDRFLEQHVYGPLGLKGLFFNDLTQPIRDVSYAATEWCPWRHMLLRGQVHDDNAWAVGGVCGHAGLFGNAWEIYRLLMQLLTDYRDESDDSFFDQQLLSGYFVSPPGFERALGFDLPGHSNASCGQFFSPRSIGHLGFTGTSFWMDLEKGIGVILLTNRVHPSRYSRGNPPLIRRFRPCLHDMVMKVMGCTSPYRSEYSL
ncbi:MAG: serine hydrolase domain-containing protein [Desulfatirhabdiaceae bacterium]